MDVRGIWGGDVWGDARIPWGCWEGMWCLYGGVGGWYMGCTAAHLSSVRVYAIVCIAFAGAGHHLAGSCELGPYNFVLPLPTAASAKHCGDAAPVRFRVQGFPCI